MNLTMDLQRNFFIARAHKRTRSIVQQILACFSGVFISLANLPAQAALKTPTIDQSTLNNPSLDVCLPAIQSLGRSRNGASAPLLIAAYDAEQRDLVRRAIVDALTLLRQPAARPVFFNALQSNDAQLRQSAVIGLSALGDPDSEIALADHAASETDFAVMAHLIPALGRARHAQAHARLQALRKHSDPRLREMAESAAQSQAQKGGLPK